MTEIHSPATMNSLLSLYSKHPDAALSAGGTSFLSSVSKAAVPMIIRIDEIDELAQIKRWERFVEISACVRIDKILRLGRNILPSILLEGLQQSLPATIRHLATLGGGVCLPGRRSDFFPVLHILGARLELRRLGETRWVPVQRFASLSGTLVFEPGEILTRIRIPVQSWDVMVFRKTGCVHVPDLDDVVFIMATDVQKGQISDFRFCFKTLHSLVIRHRETEGELANRPYPVPPSQLSGILSNFMRFLKDYNRILSDHHMDCIESLLFNQLRYGA